MTREIKIGLALGGGGAKGVAHIGVLKVLTREGIKIDYLAGTSAGAAVAAAWSLGMSISELENEAAWLANPSNWHELVSLGNIKKSLIGNTDLLAYLNRLLKYSHFEHLKIPLQIVTTDLTSGQEVLLTQGSLAEAVLASSSIPGILPPIARQGTYLVDGGVANQTPASVVEAMGADLVLAVDLMLDSGTNQLDDPNLVDTLLQSYEIMRRQSVKYSLEKAAYDFVLIQPEFKDVTDMFKFGDSDKFINAGVLAAEKCLPDIKQKLASLQA